MEASATGFRIKHGMTDGALGRSGEGTPYGMILRQAQAIGPP
ncbi:MAG: hypothetical protein O2783_05240 [Chloroflexi bacterium]|nr:hypothetical protein [Chloroflexota bacterium]